MLLILQSARVLANQCRAKGSASIFEAAKMKMRLIDSKCAPDAIRKD